MKVLWCAALSFACVFLTSETCSAEVYRPNRASGVDEAENGRELAGWNFSGSPSQRESGIKVARRRPRCYDGSGEEAGRETVTVKYLPAKWPAWAGTLYHHRILHPYHDWSNTGIIGDPWNHETSV